MAVASTSVAKLMLTAMASSPAVSEEVNEALSPRILLTGPKRFAHLPDSAAQAAALQDENG